MKVKNLRSVILIIVVISVIACREQKQGDYSIIRVEDMEVVSTAFPGMEEKLTLTYSDALTRSKENSDLYLEWAYRVPAGVPESNSGCSSSDEYIVCQREVYLSLETIDGEPYDGFELVPDPSQGTTLLYLNVEMFQGETTTGSLWLETGGFVFKLPLSDLVDPIQLNQLKPPFYLVVEEG